MMKHTVLLFVIMSLTGCASADWITPDAISLNMSTVNEKNLHPSQYNLGLTWFIPQPSEFWRRPTVNKSRTPGRLPSGLFQPLVIEDDSHAAVHSEKGQ